MHRIRVLTIWALLTPLSVTLVAADTAQETFERTYSFSAGDRLTLSNTNGDVQVEAWDRNEVYVRAHKRVKTRSGRAEEALEELRIDVEVTSSGVEIETDYPHWRSLFGWNSVSASVEYDVRVPRNADLDVRTVNGEVEVAGVDGRIELRSTNGDLGVADSSGSVDAGTTNGSIHVELTQVSSSGMEFHTTNGGIRVYLPADVRASVDARTTNGSIDTDFPISVRGTVRKNRITGDINGGGPDLELRTTNGSIRLREQ